MDVFLLLLVCGVVSYAAVLGLHAALKVDREEWRERERVKKGERKKLDEVWDDIVSRIKDDG